MPLEIGRGVADGLARECGEKKAAHLVCDLASQILSREPMRYIECFDPPTPGTANRVRAGFRFRADLFERDLVVAAEEIAVGVTDGIHDGGL